MVQAEVASPCVLSFFILSRVADVELSLFFLLFLPFFDFDLDIACFILSFSCGYYAVFSVSVSAATRLGYDINIRTLVRTLRSRLFIFVLRHTICFSYCVSSVFVFLLK